MKVKKLNLKDALSLASTVNQYVDWQSLNDNALEEIFGLVSKIPIEKYIKILSILLQTKEEKVAELEESEALALFVGGMKVNKITTLIGFYRNLHE